MLHEINIFVSQKVFSYQLLHMAWPMKWIVDTMVLSIAEKTYTGEQGWGSWEKSWPQFSMGNDSAFWRCTSNSWQGWQAFPGPNCCLLFSASSQVICYFCISCTTRSTLPRYLFFLSCSNVSSIIFKFSPPLAFCSIANLAQFYTLP